MSIISLSYFDTGIKNIPNLDAPETSEAVTALIELYEPYYLQDVLGYPLYKVFMDEIAMEEVPERAANLLNGAEFTYNGALLKWSGFKDEATFESPIADYVMANYVSNNSNATTGVGEMLPKSVHADMANPLPKVMQNWNSMVRTNKLLLCFLDANSLVYPEFDGRIYAGMFKPINYFGI